MAAGTIAGKLAIVATEDKKKPQKRKTALGYSSSQNILKAPERRSKSSEVIKKDGKDSDKEEDNDNKP